MPLASTKATAFLLYVAIAVLFTVVVRAATVVATVTATVLPEGEIQPPTPPISPDILLGFGGAPLCYPCSRPQQCDSRVCIQKMCVRFNSDVYVCKRLQLRSGLGRIEYGMNMQSKDKPDCKKCKYYWECESGRCVNNDICAKDAWVYASCLHKAYNSATSRRRRRQRLRRRLHQRSLGRHKHAKYSFKTADADGTSGVKTISTDVADSNDDGLDIVTSSGVDSIQSSSSLYTGSSHSNLVYVCKTCDTGADCKKAKGELCVRNLCVQQVEDLFQCLMWMGRQFDPRWLGSAINMTLTAGPGGMWKFLLGRKDDCSFCNEWYDCRSQRCMESRCVSREEDLVQCRKNDGGDKIQKRNHHRRLHKHSPRPSSLISSRHLP